MSEEEEDKLSFIDNEEIEDMYLAKCIDEARAEGYGSLEELRQVLRS
jgi:hypothetical protein